MAELQKLMPCLTFQKGDAEEAMSFYVGLFDDGEVVTVERRGPGEPAPEGTIKLAVFQVAGQQISCTDSPPVHDWDFTPAIALFVRCGSREELDKVWGALSEGGQVFMPVDDYGFGPFGFVADRFGVSWNVALA